ncbi:uncharacterized protein MKK02DRAFT_45849 [Dioszegia hungarica]|uniref:Uncharacterized protein n=1 Tax=Dioszegia hungarica TaxID=4972 RepID=A0AA38LWT8_9TREE|nr:uncharacterized protein MKK02DRAFT_45849 [Dioszegia hungarica]KAI9637139.1 hypothetical protein MKK02DRAFT_45849 [Dioszegia hungarica]
MDASTCPRTPLPTSIPHIEYSVTIKTSSRPLSSFDGPFVLTLHSPHSEPAIYDFPSGRFPRNSSVRFYLVYESAIPPPSAISVQARYALGWTKWRISSIRLLAVEASELPSELVAGRYRVPGISDPPIQAPLAAVPTRSADRKGSGSAWVHVWLPAWNLALHQAPDDQPSNTAVSTLSSSSSTLISQKHELDGWTLRPSLGHRKVSWPSQPRSDAPLAGRTTFPTPLAPIFTASAVESWGHTSMSIYDSPSPPSPPTTPADPDDFVSLWPQTLPGTRIPRIIQNVRKMRCEPRWSASLESDSDLQRRPPDVSIPFSGVDVSGVRRWAAEMKREGRNYTLLDWNCAKAIFEALSVGLADKQEGNSDDGWNGSGRLAERGMRAEMWNCEAYVRYLTERRVEKRAEGVLGILAEKIGTMVPADLIPIVERIKAEGY